MSSDAIADTSYTGGDGAGGAEAASVSGLRHDELSTYLNDHLGGAAAGCRLADRLARLLPDPQMNGVDIEIRRDRDSLQRLMDDLGIGQSRIKRLGGVLGEALTRLKLRLRRSDPDNVERLLGIEALSMGVEGKLRLWRGLQRVADTDTRLAGAPLADLAARGSSSWRPWRRCAWASRPGA